MIHAVCVTMTHANDDVIMQFKKYQFLYLPETTFLTRLLKAAPLSCFFELGSCGLSGPKILILVKVKFFSKNFEKWGQNFKKKIEIFDKNGHARWAVMQVDFSDKFLTIFLKFWIFEKFRVFEKFWIFEKILKISKKISRCKIEIIFCKITKTRIRVETLCGNYRIG